MWRLDTHEPDSHDPWGAGPDGGPWLPDSGQRRRGAGERQDCAAQGDRPRAQPPGRHKADETPAALTLPQTGPGTTLRPAIPGGPQVWANKQSNEGEPQVRH